MSTRGVSDSDVVDVLMGQATDAVTEHVQTARNTDPQAASTYEFWSTVLAAVDAERQEARTIAQNALHAALERRELRAGGKSGIGQGESDRSYPGRSSYGFGRYARVAMVMSCVVAVGFSSSLYFLVKEALDSGKSSSVNGIQSASQGAQVGDELVAFLFPGSSDNMRGRVETLRTNNFSEILFSAAPGATIMLQTDSASVLEQETTRIDKPIRIEVTDAPVRIARFNR